MEIQGHPGHQRAQSLSLNRSDPPAPLRVYGRTVAGEGEETHVQKDDERTACHACAESVHRPCGRPETRGGNLCGGCFWCVESAFEGVPGVISVVSGYTGGTTEDPTYEDVSSGSTGHAEAVQVTYDPKRVTYSRLLDVFWRQIDPTDGGDSSWTAGPSTAPGYSTTPMSRDALRKSPRRTWRGRGNITGRSSRRSRGRGSSTRPRTITRTISGRTPYGTSSTATIRGGTSICARPGGRGPRLHQTADLHGGELQEAGQGNPEKGTVAPAVRGHPGGGHRAAIQKRVLGQPS